MGKVNGGRGIEMGLRAEAKRLLRKVLPLRTSTFIWHHGQLREALLEQRRDAVAQASDVARICEQLDGLLARIDALDWAVRDLRARSGRTEAALRGISVKLDEYLDPALYQSALCQWYTRRTGRPLDLSNPRTFSEKLQWAKLYDRDPLRTRLADKLAVREWVAQKIGEEYLVPLIATYKYAREIDFDALPNGFVLKANHGSGYNAVVRDKRKEDLEALRRRADSWLHEDYAFRSGFELHYHGIERRIIVEEYVEGMGDYQFFCFDGKVRMVEHVTDPKGDPHVSYYDPDWNNLHIERCDWKPHAEDVPRPDGLDEMATIAETLSAGIPHVRVDLYLLQDGSIRFGEMTFTSTSGACPWKSSDVDVWLGELYELPSGDNQR